MNKVIWSAFAMSLMMSSLSSIAQTEAVDDFLGLESEVAPKLEGDQKFTPKGLHQVSSWRVTPESTIRGSQPFKGQSYSLTNWEDLNTDRFLSIKNWMIEREERDKIPEWVTQIRTVKYKELFGKVLQCRGDCFIYRGVNKARAQHLSQLMEGDDIVTGKDSVAWIYTMDGGLIRLSPDSSVAVQEINFSKDKIFLLMRLNHGHIFWSGRTAREHEINTDPETDSYSLPVMVRGANQEFFEAELYKNQKFEDRPRLSDEPVVAQYRALNTLTFENNNIHNLTTQLMLVAPNVTVIAGNISLDLVHLTGGVSYFKKRTTGSDTRLHMRGHGLSGPQILENSEWLQIDKNGRSYEPLTDVPGTLQILELLTKRIKTIELAREMWVKSFTLPILNLLSNQQVLSANFGYVIWDEILKLRFDFLLQYTSKIETTNLNSLENLMEKMEAIGGKPRKELSGELYFASLNNYLFDLKNRYHSDKLKVREMNALQYYVWILRNGKF